MKLSDISKPLDEMTDEELHERLRAIKHNRTVERPAVKKRASDEAVKTEGRAKRAAKTKVDKMVDKMDDAERAALIEQLKGALSND